METRLTKKLNEWLRRQFFSKGEKVSKIQIRHIVTGGKIGTEIDTLEIEEEITDIEIDKIISQIEMICEGDAESLDGLQKYCLLPYFGENRQPSGRFILSLNLSDDFSEDSLDSEGPNKAGLTAQAMRHTEAMAKMSMASTGNIIAMQNRIIARQADEVEKLTERHIEMIGLIENLKSMQHERDLSTSMALQKQEFMGDVTQKLLMLAPVAINRLTGKNLLPAKTTTEGEMLNQFFKSIKPEQYQNLMGILSPEQQIVMLEMIKGIMDNDEKLAAEKKAAFQKPGNGAS